MPGPGSEVPGPGSEVPWSGSEVLELVYETIGESG